MKTPDDASNGTEDKPGSTAGPSSSDATLSNITFDRCPQNRVKLYVLCEQKAWDDKGTGHAACVTLPKNRGEYHLIVRLENEDRNILESKIIEQTNYQRQQGTLIVWSENDTCDLALSFQEKQGCEDVFHQILRIQSRDPTNDTVEEENSDSSESLDNWNSVNLPTCDMMHIPEIESLVSSSLSNNSTREVIASALCKGDYLSKLCELFSMAEDLEDTNTLSSLASIAKDMFLLNNQQLLSEMISDKYFRCFVGMLEFDSTVRQTRKHRDFLFKTASFQDVLKISDEKLKDKITETFRLQYVQDVCLPAPSIFEENLLTVISGSIFFNRVEIVSQVMADRELIRSLFAELKRYDIPHDRQKQLTNFLKEMCTYAQSLQPSGPQGRDQFFKMIMANDIFLILDPCMSSGQPSTQAMVVELLSMIVDFTLNTFRDFLMKQCEEDKENLLINKMLKYMIFDRDAEFTNARNIAEVIRVLLDPEAGTRSDAECFFRWFYDNAMPFLMKPVYDITADGKLNRDDYYTCRQMCMVLTIVLFCVKNHDELMRSFLIKSNFLSSVVVLLQSRHHLNCLKAVRLIRRVVDLRDDVYNRHLIEKNIFGPIVQAFKMNGPRYNLLNSCLLDLFEFIQSENINLLIDNIGALYLHEFEDVTYVKTFMKMRLKYEGRLEEANKKQMPVACTSIPSSAESTPTKNLPDNMYTQFEKEKRYEDEEAFFNSDEDIRDENDVYDNNDGPLSLVNESGKREAPVRKSGSEPMFPSVAKRKNASDDDGVASIFGGSHSSQSVALPVNSRVQKIKIKTSAGVQISPKKDPALPNAEIKSISLGGRVRRTSLVNYEDSDSDEEDEDDKSRAKKRRLEEEYVITTGVVGDNF